jgi:hypothetical protein
MAGRRRVIKEHRYVPPRLVEVFHEGQWCPGFLHAWCFYDGGRGWAADVEYTAQHEEGPSRHVPLVRLERIRFRESVTDC